MAEEEKPKEQPKEEKRIEENKETKDTKVEGLEAEELKSAASLYKALKDPDTASEIIESLARRAGLLDRNDDLKRKDGESRKDVKDKIEGKVHKIFKAKLGKDYEKFSDVIGPLIDEAIQDYMKEHMGKVDLAGTEKAWSTAVDGFMESHEVPKKVEAMMQELIEDSPPNFSNKNFNAKRYLNRMYKNALEELDMPEPTKENEEEMKLPGTFKVVKRPEKVSTDDAIEAAIKGIRYK